MLTNGIKVNSWSIGLLFSLGVIIYYLFIIIYNRVLNIQLFYMMSFICICSC